MNNNNQFMSQDDAMKQVKKPSGCWWLSGCLITVVSLLLIAVCVGVVVSSEKELDRKRAEYAASVEEYEKAMEAYEADTVNVEKPEFVPRGVIGVNIGAAFFVLFAFAMLVPLAVGVGLLLYYRRRRHLHKLYESDNVL